MKNRTAMSLCILLFIANLSGQRSDRISSLSVYTAGGSQIRISRIQQDETPMMWIFIRPGHPYSEKFMESLAGRNNDGHYNVDFDDFRAYSNLRTLFFCQMTPEEAAGGKLYDLMRSGRKGIPADIAFSFTGMDLPYALTIKSFPSVVIFDGDGNILLNRSGPVSKSELNEYFTGNDDFPFMSWQDIRRLTARNAKSGKVSAQLIAGLLGKGEDAVISMLGLPLSVEYDVFPDVTGDEYRYDGLLLQTRSNAVKVIKFMDGVSPGNSLEPGYNAFGKPVFGNVFIGSSRAEVENLLGEPDERESLFGLENSFYFHRSLDIYYTTVNNSEKLESVTITGMEAVEGLYSAARESLYKISSLAAFLLKPEKQLVDVLGQPEAPAQINGNFRDLFYLSKGFAFTFDTSQDAAFALTLLAESGLTTQYEYPLPAGLKWEMEPPDIRKLMGKPSREVNQFGALILDYSHKGFMFYFDGRSEMLTRIQMFYNIRDQLIGEN